MLIVVCAYLIFVKLYEKQYRTHDAFDKGEEEEGLLNYFEALTQEDRDSLLDTEEHFSNHYGLKRFGFRQF